MEKSKIDLKAEQQSSIETPRYKYSLAAKFFFFSMDLLAGKKDTLPKAKLLEILASIPYRAWEVRHYTKQTRKYKELTRVRDYQEVIDWSRDAQDNEYMHLLVIHQKMVEDGMKDTWYLSAFMRFFIVLSYVIIAKITAFFSQKGAYLFNAEFENHAELVYANMVKDNPEWENQPMNNEFVKKYYIEVENWADVFRRIALDERDHMNHSFFLAGKTELIHKYDGMPELH
ncbi:alternative oxidase [Natronoflexus pectinivorans]|uniref:Alternative oxidase n=1 Tax=Natronoflexus pectinivorans TaxID=682526 RepID=A0A4R2GDU4_9BACT|nr:alternative oxidase [Natronoflexus pectinivorans]TCO06123.1 alternative oxidase [Natronoflexus pectinivorans]